MQTPTHRILFFFCDSVCLSDHWYLDAEELERGFACATTTLDAGRSIKGLALADAAFLIPGNGEECG